MKTLENLKAILAAPPSGVVVIDETTAVLDPCELFQPSGPDDGWCQFLDAKYAAGDATPEAERPGYRLPKKMVFEGVEFLFIPGITGDGNYGGVSVNTGTIALVAPEGTDLEATYDPEQLRGFNWSLLNTAQSVTTIPTDTQVASHEENRPSKRWTEHYGQKPWEGLMTREDWNVYLEEDNRVVVEFAFEGRPVHCRNIYRKDGITLTLIEGNIEHESGENPKNLAIALAWAKKQK